MSGRRPIVRAAEVPSWDYEVDVAVVGAGGCGMAAALSAADAGAEVLLLERDRQGVCNTARSGGMLPAAGTRFQREAGIRESPEALAADILKKNGGNVDRDLVLRLCDRAVELVEWLVDRQGLRLEVVTDFKYPGHSQYRMHAPPERTGRSLFSQLRDAVGRERRIQLVPGVSAEGLIASADGALLGVVVGEPSGREHVRARAVILANNGFGGNPEMIARHIPSMAKNVFYFGGEESTGEGIEWGQALGAATAFMDAYQAHASIAQPGGIMVSYAVIMHGGVQVNLEGRRFADESRGYSEHALDVAVQPGGVAVEVFDRRIHELTLCFPDYAQCVENGLVRSAESLPALAAAFGLPPEALVETVERANEARRRGAADEVGRRDAPRPLESPFHGVQVGAALIHTQGGLKVDARARVLRPDGRPIPNLFAGGGVAAGVSGHGAGGYLSGNGLLTALGFGRIAGEEAAKAGR